MLRNHLGTCLFVGLFALTPGACKVENNTALQTPEPADAAPDASPVIAQPEVAPPPDSLATPPDTAFRSDSLAAQVDTATSTDVPALPLDAPSFPDVSTPTLDTVSREIGVAPGEVGAATAALVVDKSTVNLGPLDLNMTGVGTLTVTNVGKVTSGAVIVSASSGVYVAGCDGALAAFASCTLTIKVTSTAAGAFSGTVSISANPGTIAPTVVAVTASIACEGVFSAYPSVIDLGNLFVGIPAPKQTITVTTPCALSDLGVTQSGPDISVDKAASTCTAALAAGASCTVVVNFIAASAGSKSDGIVISAGGAGGKVVSVPITAVAQNTAKLVISPSAAAFAAAIGTTSSPIVFGVANAGDVATGALSVAMTGANAADFTMTSTCMILAPLAACTVSVAWKPVALSATAANATLTVADLGVGASTVSVALTGTAYSNDPLAITSTTSDLGTVLLGTTGPSTVFTLTNSGNAATGALAITVSSTEFIVTSDTCTGSSIAEGSGCTIAIALKPTTVGAKSAVLTVTGTSGNPVVKAFTGTGISGPSPNVSPAAIDFGSIAVGLSSTGPTVTVKNNGGSATGVLSFTKGGNFTVFPITANTCVSALAPGASCIFAVAFAPTAAQHETATFTVTDGSVSATVAVSGTGTPG